LELQTVEELGIGYPDVVSGEDKIKPSLGLLSGKRGGRIKNLVQG
jgi:hypothetical protein